MANKNQSASYPSTDNGGENRGEFYQYIGKCGIAHYFIPKSSPQWDGAVERAHGVIDQEYYLNPNFSFTPWLIS